MDYPTHSLDRPLAPAPGYVVQPATRVPTCGRPVPDAAFHTVNYIPLKYYIPSLVF